MQRSPSALLATAAGLLLLSAAAAAVPAAAPPAAAAPKTSGIQATGDATKDAEAVFNRYRDLEHAFDPALADLYANDAKIERHIVVPGRKPVVRTWTGSQYKQLVRNAMAKAKPAGKDLVYYTNITYTREGDKVRIRAACFAELQHAVSPIQLLVGADRDGRWRVLEELSESHPVTTPPPAAAPKATTRS